MDRYERLERAVEQIDTVLRLMESEGVAEGHLAYHLLVNARTVVHGTADLMRRDGEKPA